MSKRDLPIAVYDRDGNRWVRDDSLSPGAYRFAPGYMQMSERSLASLSKEWGPLYLAPPTPIDPTEYEGSGA